MGHFNLTSNLVKALFISMRLLGWLLRKLEPHWYCWAEKTYVYLQYLYEKKLMHVHGGR